VHAGQPVGRGGVNVDDQTEQEMLIADYRLLTWVYVGFVVAAVVAVVWR